MHGLTLFCAGLEPALPALDRIDASPSITVRFATAGNHEAGRPWLERLAPRPITYTDAVSFAVMATAKCKHVLAFDEDFAAAGFELGADNETAARTKGAKRSKELKHKNTRTGK